MRHLHARPDIDGFSEADTAKCSRWWGPGSPFGEDAFLQSWSGLTLWLNPPFSRLDEVLAKIIRDEAHALLVMPQWELRSWYKLASKLTLEELFFPKYTKVFSLDGDVVKGAP